MNLVMRQFPVALRGRSRRRCPIRKAPVSSKRAEKKRLEQQGWPFERQTPAFLGARAAYRYMCVGALRLSSMAPLEIAKVEQDWSERGFSCGLWVDPPGQVWKDYVHATDELLMVVEGEMEVEIDGKPFRLAAGQELFIPAGAAHTVRNLGNTTARWLYGYRRRG